MQTKEKDIKYEAGDFWVLDTKDTYTVMWNGPTHYSTPESSYKRDIEGLSIAVARCNYLARTNAKGEKNAN